jgi:hypothetical protein
MKLIIAAAFILFMLYAGIHFALIAFGMVRPKFKNFNHEVRFKENYRKHHLIMKAGAIFFLISFTATVIRSGIVEKMFSQ